MTSFTNPLASSRLTTANMHSFYLKVSLQNVIFLFHTFVQKKEGILAAKDTWHVFGGALRIKQFIYKTESGFGLSNKMNQ